MLCVPLAGHAAECSYKVTVTPPLSKNWTVETGDIRPTIATSRPNPVMRLHPFDRIMVTNGASVTRAVGG